jgi:hypothetical protein
LVANIRAIVPEKRSGNPHSIGFALACLWTFKLILYNRFAAAICDPEQNPRVTYLTTAPLWLAALVLVGLTSVIAMVGPIIVRRRVSLDRLRTNNEVAGFKFATVGVIYAVLLGFAVIVVWEKFSDAENDVALEAAASANIFRLAQGIKAEPGVALRDSMSSYLKAAVTLDWPAMKDGRGSPKATSALNDVYSAALRWEPTDSRGAAIFAEVLHQLDLVTQARRARIVVAAGIVPGIVWLVLFGGAFITIAFTFFFGTPNLRAQAMMTGALTVLIFSGLLVIIAIDHPFSGTVRVEPEPLETVLADFSARPEL